MAKKQVKIVHCRSEESLERCINEEINDMQNHLFDLRDIKINNYKPDDGFSHLLAVLIFEKI